MKLTGKRTSRSAARPPGVRSVSPSSRPFSWFGRMLIAPRHGADRQPFGLDPASPDPPSQAHSERLNPCGPLASVAGPIGMSCRCRSNTLRVSSRHAPTRRSPTMPSQLRIKETYNETFNDPDSEIPCDPDARRFRHCSLGSDRSGPRGPSSRRLTCCRCSACAPGRLRHGHEPRHDADDAADDGPAAGADGTRHDGSAWPADGHDGPRWHDAGHVRDHGCRWRRRPVARGVPGGPWPDLQPHGRRRRRPGHARRDAGVHGRIGGRIDERLGDAGRADADARDHADGPRLE
jgi:hypothetical protein